MKLHEHEDFAAFVTAAAAEADLSEPFVEKDYWITEILRTVADTLGNRAIFKGGTSLSKGWDLLDRFSEDIDLFVNPAVEPALPNARAIDRMLKHSIAMSLPFQGLTSSATTLARSAGSAGWTSSATTRTTRRSRASRRPFGSRRPLRPGW